MLVANRKLRGADDVDEQDMGNFELNLFLDLNGHLVRRPTDYMNFIIEPDSDCRACLRLFLSISRLRFAPCAAPCGFGLCFQFPQMCEIRPRVTTIRQRCSRAVDSPKSRAHKQLVQVTTAWVYNDRIVASWSKDCPPTCVNRERSCKSACREYLLLPAKF